MLKCFDQGHVVPAKEVNMQTIKRFKFKVRKEFCGFKERDRFVATVRTYQRNGLEVQDFVLEDGREFKGIPCENTQFLERGSSKSEEKGGEE
jgi:hypothetical protein